MQKSEEKTTKPTTIPAKEPPKVEENKEEPKEDEVPETIEPLKQPPSLETQLVLMKKGDYSVHVLIEEIRNLAPIEGDALPIPVVKVTCLGKTQRTPKLKMKCAEYVYAEHLYFDKTDLSVEILDSEKIIIEAFDYDHPKRDLYFGVYEFDFNYIYSNTDHALRNFWIALANPESSDITKVRGYLRLSISVLHDSDPRIELEMKTSDDPDSVCMIPPQIKMEYKQISIYILKAEELPDMDAVFNAKKVNRECNAYIEARYLGLMRRTKTVDMVNELVPFNEIIDIPVSVPAVSQKIVMIVKDEDKIGEDEIVGSFEISLNDVFKDKYKDLQYVNIYGAPLNKKGRFVDKMNENSEIGSLWKGRVLIKIENASTDNPVARTRPIEDTKFLREANNKGRPNLWSFYIRLYDTFYLPKVKDKFGVRLSVQDATYYLQPKHAVNRNISWNQNVSLMCHTLTSVPTEVPDFFIYLTNEKGDHICFQRVKSATFHNNDDIMVIKLLPDPSMGKLDEMYKSGLVKIKIKMINKNLDPPITNPNDFTQTETSTTTTTSSTTVPTTVPTTAPSTVVPHKPVVVEDDDEDDMEKEYQKYKQQQMAKNKGQVSDPKKDQGKAGSSSGGTTSASSTKPSTVPVPDIKNKTYTVVANINMTRYLISGDKSGTSDPYVIVRLLEHEKKTSVKNDCINGIWNESLVFPGIKFDLDDQSTWPVLFFCVKDKDPFYKADDILGFNYTWLSDSEYAIDDTRMLTPKWNQLFLPLSNKPQGQVLCSFYIFSDDRKDLISQAGMLPIVPETSLYTVEINVLGLRDLKPLSILPVKKAYINFDLNSINVSGKNDADLKNIKTQPKASGPNPTINYVIKFDVKLPKKGVFVPDMQCEVYDYLLAGMVNQLLGVFVLPVKNIIKFTNEMIDRDLSVTKQKLALSLIDEAIKIQATKPLQIIEEVVPEIEITKAALPEVVSEKKVTEKPLPLFKPEPNELKAPLLDKSACCINSGTDSVIDMPKSEGMIKDMPEKSQEGMIKEEEPVKEIPQMKEKKKLFKSLMTKKVAENEMENYVIKPIYKKYVLPGVEKGDKNYKEFEIEDFSQAPDRALYWSVGYNKTKDDNKKHYRRYFNAELENIPELGLRSPFYKVEIRRGRFEDKKDEMGLFEAMSNNEHKIIKRYTKVPEVKLDEDKEEQEEKESSEKNSFYDDKFFGWFKGLIRITEKQRLQEYEQAIEKIKDKHSSMLKDFKYLTQFDDISKRILTQKEVVIRVYVLELNGLANKDTLSKSDPYVKIWLGGDCKVNECKNYQDDTLECKWYKMYELHTTLPGNGILRVEVWDYDPLFSDELIGSTDIDIEDRYFDNNWQAMKEKPIENRILRHPDLRLPQGNALLWIDMFDKNERSKAIPWDITPEPPSELEMRMIIWETEDMAMMDDEGTSDIYVIGYMDQKEKQSTDVHFRCQTGAGSFNWRMLLPVKLPRVDNRLKIQVYDNDFFSSDDYICGNALDITRLIREVGQLDVPVKFDRYYYSGLKPEERNKDIEFLSKADDPDGIKFWFQMEKGGEKGGRVMMSLELLPKWKAELCKVGKGRDEPNINPYLPPPVGRFEWSLNPFRMINQCVGPKYRRRIYCACCCALVVAYLIFVVPYIALHLSGELVNPFNYGK